MRYKVNALGKDGNFYRGVIVETEIASRDLEFSTETTCGNCELPNRFCHVCAKDLENKGICFEHIDDIEHFCGLTCLSFYLFDKFSDFELRSFKTSGLEVEEDEI